MMEEDKKDKKEKKEKKEEVDDGSVLSGASAHND